MTLSQAMADWILDTLGFNVKGFQSKVNYINGAYQGGFAQFLADSPDLINLT